MKQIKIIYKNLSKKYYFNLNLTVLSIVIPFTFLTFLKILMFIGYKLDSDFKITEKDLIEISSPLSYDNYSWNCGKGGKGRIIQFENIDAFFYIPCFLREYKNNDTVSFIGAKLAFSEKCCYKFKILKKYANNLNSNQEIYLYGLEYNDNLIYDLDVYKTELKRRYDLNWFWYSIAIIIFLVLNYYAFKQY